MADTATAITIRLLGRFVITVADRTISDEPPWGSRKALHLVKLLALAPDHRLALDQLLDALWPDLDPEAGQRACHQTLYLARRVLDPDRRGLLASRQRNVALAAPGGVTVDRDQFRELANLARQAGTIAAHEAALARYTGELLPDDRYEDWAIVPRDEVQRLYARLVLDLARLHGAGGEWESACTHLERLVAADPANEEAQVALMRAHAAAGRRHRALAQYRALREALRREYDAEPEASSQRHYAAILAQHDQADAASPRPTPVPTRRNLPAATTALFGRDEAIVAVRAALREARLVTLIGAGGSGKTRLGLAVGDSLLDTYPAGVWWIDLAPLADGALLTGTIAHALGLRDQDEATLVAALRDGPALLILDNCEHLSAACATLVANLLARCPGLHILTTSREALRAAGEAIWRVPSLPFPEEAAGAVPADLPALHARIAASPAVQLFVARARLARHDFALTPENAPAVAEICRRLDGIPLALELAAARIAVLAPQHLAERLDDALRVLSGGPRTALPRHRTLRATLDWSVQLLGEAEEELLARLAVFAGGFTLVAAEAICGQAGATLETLARLVEQSLVQVDAPPGEEGEIRYRLLETVRQFAAERLAQRREDATYREQHARYFRAFAAQTPTPTLARLETEVQNLRGALEWLARHDPPGGLAMMLDLHPFWLSADHIRESFAFLTTRFALTDPANPPRLRLGALLLGGQLAFYLGDIAQMEAMARAALALATDLDLAADQARAYVLCGWGERSRGRFARAAEHQRAALALGPEGRVPPQIYYSALTELANLAIDQGDWAGGAAQYRAILARLRRVDDAAIADLLTGYSQIGLALALIFLDAHADVRTSLARSLDSAERNRRWNHIHLILVFAGLFAQRIGQPREAARLLGAADRIQIITRVASLPHVHGRFYDLAEAGARTMLGAAQYAADYAAGMARDLAGVIVAARTFLTTRRDEPGDRVAPPPPDQARRDSHP